jgi:hypothetical protein
VEYAGCRSEHQTERCRPQSGYAMRRQDGTALAALQSQQQLSRMFHNALARLSQLRSQSWPPLRAEESETLRRNKLGVRGLNGVLIGMVVVLSLVLAREFVMRELWSKLAVTSVGIAAYLVWALLGVIPFTDSVLRPVMRSRIRHGQHARGPGHGYSSRSSWPSPPASSFHHCQ